MKKFIFIYSVFCVGVTLAILWPFSRTIDHTLPNAVDPIFYAWNLNHNLQSASHGFRDLLDTNIFYPEGNTLAFSDTLFAQTIFTAPIIYITHNPILAENLYVLATFPLAAVAMFLLSYHITKHAWASVLSGIFYAFSYPRLAQIGHMPMISSQWLPLTILFLLKYIKIGSWKYLLLTWLFYLISITSSIYFGVFLLPVIFFAIRRPLKPFLISFIPFCIILAIALYPYIRLKAENLTIKRSLDDTGRFSAQLIDYVTILPTSTIGRFGIYRMDINEKPLYPTVTVVALAALGLFAGWKSQRKYVLLFALSALFAFILSFGPDKQGIKLPYYYLYSIVPLLQTIRVPARFSIMVMLSLSVLAAIGITHIRSKPKVRIIICLAVLLFFIEVWQEHTPSVPVPTGKNIPAVYQWLAENPYDDIIVELPFRLLWRGVPINDQIMLTYDQSKDKDVLATEAYRTYFSIYHRKRMLNGYSGFFPQSYFDQSGLLDNFPTPESVALLEQLRVRFILIHAWQYTDKNYSDVQRQLTQYPNIRFVERFGDDYVYEL